MNTTRRTVATIPFSKAADPAHDEEALTLTYQLMDHYPDILDGQHPIRRWEYGMALRTIRAWASTVHDFKEGPLRIMDVGGAGSGFWKALRLMTPMEVLVVDPGLPAGAVLGEGARLYLGTVEEYCAASHLGQFDVITAISVVEHVVNVRPFLKAIRALLRPNGLLFLTTDYTNTEGEDVFHFHWMRERIYNAGRIRKLLDDARDIGFRSFGEADWSYHGHHVYDYSVCSVAVIRKDPNGQHPRE